MAWRTLGWGAVRLRYVSYSRAYFFHSLHNKQELEAHCINSISMMEWNSRNRSILIARCRYRVRRAKRTRYGVSHLNPSLFLWHFLIFSVSMPRFVALLILDFFFSFKAFSISASCFTLEISSTMKDISNWLCASSST